MVDCLFQVSLACCYDTEGDARFSESHGCAFGSVEAGAGLDDLVREGLGRPRSLPGASSLSGWKLASITMSSPPASQGYTQSGSHPLANCVKLLVIDIELMSSRSCESPLAADAPASLSMDDDAWGTVEQVAGWLDDSSRLSARPRSCCGS
jgi:hypothetical protein